MFGLFESKKEKQLNLVGKGMAAMTSGKFNAAEGYFLKAVGLNVLDAPEAWMGLGTLYFAAEMFDKSKGCFETALDQKPDDYHAIRGMALVERKLGNDDHAVELFKQLQIRFGYKPDEDPTQTPAERDWFRANGL